MVLGGPLAHVMAAKAVALAEARQPAFAAYAAAIVANAQALADGLLRRGVRLVTGGTDNHLVLARRRRQLRADRPPGRVGAAGRRGRDQPQQRPARPQRRLVHLRHPARHPRADHARLRRRPRWTRSPTSSPPRCGATAPAAATRQGQVHPGRPGRGQFPRALRRAAQPSPALPGYPAVTTQAPYAGWCLARRLEHEAAPALVDAEDKKLAHEIATRVTAAKAFAKQPGAGW